jgi:hypothetical protein
MVIVKELYSPENRRRSMLLCNFLFTGSSMLDGFERLPFFKTFVKRE